MSIHKSVLLKESIEALNIKSGDIVVDATLGGGGHSCEILKLIGESGKLIAIDQDTEALEKFKIQKNVFLVNDNFSNLDSILKDLKAEKVDAVVADLGISSDQLEDKERGLSFQLEAALDMRMDRKQSLTAKEIINEWSEADIRNILKNYGEENFAGKIAKEIVEVRKEKKIETTLELARLVEKSIPRRFQKKKIHPATKTFQALRIAVNGEMENLEKFIPAAVEALNLGGRLAIITFHSLEDRLVKNIFRENARGCICPPALKLQDLQKKYMEAVALNDPQAEELERALKEGPKKFPKCLCGKVGKVKIINKKPIVPSLEEVRNNPRARSAKLRVCEKK
jgi:16S rRNA (cytosine1402-N4)-methyltransferase